MTIELWNIHHGQTVYVGAQRIVNVLGRLSHPSSVTALNYSLNDDPPVPVVFKQPLADINRLARDGDFNIDTINRQQLRPINRLVMTAHLKDGRSSSKSVDFQVKGAPCYMSPFSLNLNQVVFPEEVGQLVDGHWKIATGEDGERCLEIERQDEGLDRIILFGPDQLCSGYRIKARLCVDQWLGPPHSVGLLFHWQPHLQGDGTILPSQWSTGLGYYYSHCPGLRIRVGVDVHYNAQGVKEGDHVLREAILSRWRHRSNALRQCVFGNDGVVSQVVLGRQYWFHMEFKNDLYALTVWPVHRAQPRPQVVVDNPPTLLEKGAVGIIAHRCAVRVFEFAIEPSS